jgi:hypothetical protein
VTVLLPAEELVEELPELPVAALPDVPDDDVPDDDVPDDDVPDDGAAVAPAALPEPVPVPPVKGVASAELPPAASALEEVEVW